MLTELFTIDEALTSLGNNCIGTSHDVYRASRRRDLLGLETDTRYLESTSLGKCPGLGGFGAETIGICRGKHRMFVRDIRYIYISRRP